MARKKAECFPLPSQPGLVFQCHSRKGHDPPHQKSRYQPVRNPIKKGKTLICTEIIERKEKGCDRQEGQVADDEGRVDHERIGDDPQRKNMDRMEDVQEEEIQNRQNAVLFPVGLEHELSEKDRLPDIAPGPAEVHFVHLAEFGGDLGIDNSVGLIPG